ncbi:hypothetical protein GCM10009753_75540 [Streptantibioticus ferralitis]
MSARHAADRDPIGVLLSAAWAAGSAVTMGMLAALVTSPQPPPQAHQPAPVTVPDTAPPDNG